MSTDSHIRGMTLVEVLVSGILATIVVGVIVTIITLYGAEIKEGTANSVLTMRLENVSDELSRKVRGGVAVLGASDVLSSIPYLSKNTVSGFEVVGIDSLVDTAFAVVSGELHAGPDLDNLSAIKYAGKNVTVDPSGNFVLSANRKAVTLNFRLTDGDYSLSFGGGTFRCRN